MSPDPAEGGMDMLWGHLPHPMVKWHLPLMTPYGAARVLERAVGARATNALGERIFRRNKGPELALSRARRSTTIPAQPIADHTTLF
ncbi:MAG: hypothetical protein DWI23_01280 [Planctomycetota bacterium]|jgi:hypothetical protein|nr:MAG: hypothetical protein DWI23_01280 [Planctomycetota bacterium]